MRKRGIIWANAGIVILILVSVFFYTLIESRNKYERQLEHLKFSVVSMERVTENYLEGEQRICDVWAHYINTHDLTMKEAADFVRGSHVLETASAHLVLEDSLEGISTREAVDRPGSFEVSYRDSTLLEDFSWIAPLGEAINITRAYTNPMNGEESMAFCNRITLREGPAVLLRVMPLEELEQKWVFPQEEFQSAELTLIDGSGDYIIKGKSFEKTGFFEYYQAYNRTNEAGLSRLKAQVTGSTGTMSMMDGQGRRCVVAFTPTNASHGRVLIGMMPAADLNVGGQDWMLIGIVTSGLVAMLIMDFAYMQRVNRRLRQLAAEAESANRSKTEFLSTMSHDIRTPMNAIIGLTTLTERNIGDQQTVRENLRKISLAGNHLLTLINDILDISKVESGKQSLSPLTFSIVETVENLVNLSQPMIREKNIDFKFRINRMEKEYLYADQLRLNQIYINILSNAIKYTEPGGQVSVDLREEHSEKPGCVKLTYIVADTGIGMSPEFMKKMYQPFSRQTDSRVNSIQGTGLGLAITKQMVDLMGGKIDCQSELGKGTTFTIDIDIPAADRQRDEMRLETMDVLLADDDPVLLETAMDTLESLGLRAETAENGMEAVSRIVKRHDEGLDYDVVILDWRMPGMDGVETVRQIRQAVGDALPILLISAYDWSDIEDEARAAGANGFISKPLFRSRLYDKLNEMLGMEPKSSEPEDDYSDLHGLRILVAEDNDINWEIISAMMSMFGISTDRAENGRVCVDMMSQAPEGKYALIFMDVQMPEMNGLEATRNIRRLPEKWAREIPIIAMTADAFSENIAECLEAGMNGHIAKPVDLKLVIKEIRRVKEEKKKRNS